jgi:hypothetical protein
MKRLQPALAASLSVLVGLAALVPVADARGGGFGGGGGGFGGHSGGFSPGGFNGGRNFGPGFNGYGPQPGRPNPYANNAWVGPVDISPYMTPPPNNNGSSMPNNCDYLFQKANDSYDGATSSYWWSLFNDCSHNR